MKKKDPEVVFRGRSLSKGIAIGKPWVISSKEKKSFFKKIEKNLPCEKIELEIEKYHRALKKSHLDLKNLQKMFALKGESAVPELLEAQIEILHDPLFTETVEKKIRALKQPSHFAFNEVIQEYKKCFYTIEDEFFEERLKDIVDVSNRVLKHLAAYTKRRIPKKSILIGKEIFLTQIAEASPSRVLAFITEEGGIASHAAIIARSKKIPYITSVDLKALSRHQVNSLIVDGVNGLVIINPSLQTLKKYETLLKQLEEHELTASKEKLLPSCTQDNREIELFASIDLEMDLDTVDLQEVKGIGLMRSEFCFFNSTTFPLEEDQYLLYQKAAEKLKNAPFILRLFDLGGEKNFFFSSWREKLSLDALLYRGVRFLLEEKQLLQTQLRAILRVFSLHKNIQLLIPMVSDLSEIREVKALIVSLAAELNISSSIPIGCMIETPASALLCEHLLKEVDFFVIGSNDLTQYTLGIDRNRATPTIFHPAMLKLLKLIIEKAQIAAKPVYLCGEIAQDIHALPLVLGLGIRKLTVNLGRIGDMKHAIRNVALLDAQKQLLKALEVSSAKELVGMYCALKNIDLGRK